MPYKLDLCRSKGNWEKNQQWTHPLLAKESSLLPSGHFLWAKLNICLYLYISLLDFSARNFKIWQAVNKNPLWRTHNYFQCYLYTLLLQQYSKSIEVHILPSNSLFGETSRIKLSSLPKATHIKWKKAIFSTHFKLASWNSRVLCLYRAPILPGAHPMCMMSFYVRVPCSGAEATTEGNK